MARNRLIRVKPKVFLEKHGREVPSFDPSVFYILEKSIYMTVYVDDFDVYGSDQALLTLPFHWWHVVRDGKPLPRTYGRGKEGSNREACQRCPGIIGKPRKLSIEI